VQVHLRSTDTSVECASTTCTATVTDTDSGTPSPPSGTVTFASDRPGEFNENPCTLSALSNTSASCSVTFTAYSSAVCDISASYSGDSSHAGSASSAPSALASRQLAAAPRSASRPQTRLSKGRSARVAALRPTLSSDHYARQR